MPDPTHDALSDPARLAALRKTGLLDSPPEEPFDRLTRLASKLLDVPVALVSLVEDDRQFFKSAVGLPEPYASRRETPLTHSFCQHVTVLSGPLLVKDARTHPLVKDNQAVTDLDVIAYAGVPLEGRDGQTLGSLCAIDTKPRGWSPEDVAVLEDLAAAAMSKIERRVDEPDAPVEASDATAQPAAEPHRSPQSSSPSRNSGEGRAAAGASLTTPGTRSITAQMAVACLVLAAVIGGVFAVLAVAIHDLQVSNDASARAQETINSVTRLEKLAIDAQTGNRGFLISRNESFLEPLKQARDRFPAEARRLRSLVADEGAGKAPAEDLIRRIDSYITGYALPIAELSRTHLAKARRSVARGEGKVRVDAISAVAEALLATEGERAAARRQTAKTTAGRAVALGTGGLVGSILLLLAFAGYLTRYITVPVRRAAAAVKRLAAGDLSTRVAPGGSGEVRELGQAFNQMATSIQRGRDELARQHTELEVQRQMRETQTEFTETLQVTRSEGEAHEILKRHLERSVPRSVAVVLNRNEGAGRLEASTALPADSNLQVALSGGKASPDACLASRLGRAHTRDGDREPLLNCELCGMTAESSTCTPVLVSGQVFGSVLVLHREPPRAEERRLMAESVTQAAPVLANLRNLARAEERALTDAVTGLPNRRAVEEQLEGFMARGRRTGEPLALIMADLDHFKRVNDTYGHDKGDDVLGGIAAVLRNTLRQSDFVGRYGGEEFLLLLPDTDHLGALAAAAKLHGMIGKSHIPGLNEPVTCSFGVAAFPEHASDSETLLRAADQALYRAKGNGRNRVESAEELDLTLESAPGARTGTPGRA